MNLRIPKNGSQILDGLIPCLIPCISRTDRKFDSGDFIPELERRS